VPLLTREGWNDPFAPVPASLDPTIELSERRFRKQEGIENALTRLDVVLKQPRAGDLRITRGKPHTETTKSWEHVDLVLVWHSAGHEMPDGIVRSRLSQSKLWQAVGEVILVEGFLPNAAVFRSAPDLYGLAGDEFKKVGFAHDTSLPDSICAVQLDALGLKRWEVAFEAIKESLATGNYRPPSLEQVVMSRMLRTSTQVINESSGFDTRWASQMWQASEKSDFVVDEIANWPLIDEGKMHAVLGMTIAKTLYGVTHALAWHGDFPTNGERHLWRSACLTIAIIPIMVTPLALSWDWADRHTSAGGIIEVFAASIWYSILLLAITAAAVYPVARSYITLESFISLRRLPVGAYETPAGTKLLLHW
jgi:hypothetical protein